MDLSAFLAENAIPPEEEAAFVVSKRFLSDETDKKGNRKPLQWKLKAITGAEDESLHMNEFTRSLLYVALLVCVPIVTACIQKGIASCR